MQAQSTVHMYRQMYCSLGTMSISAHLPYHMAVNPFDVLRDCVDQGNILQRLSWMSAHTATIMVKSIQAAGKLSRIIYSTLEIGSMCHGATTFQQMLDQHSFQKQHSKWHRNFLDHISKIAINCSHHIFKASKINLSGSDWVIGTNPNDVDGLLTPTS